MIGVSNDSFYKIKIMEVLLHLITIHGRLQRIPWEIAKGKQRSSLLRNTKSLAGDRFIILIRFLRPD